MYSSNKKQFTALLALDAEVPDGPNNGFHPIYVQISLFYPLRVHLSLMHKFHCWKYTSIAEIGGFRCYFMEQIHYI
jgi:hypothetical protein